MGTGDRSVYRVIISSLCLRGSIASLGNTSEDLTASGEGGTGLLVSSQSLDGSVGSINKESISVAAERK